MESLQKFFGRLLRESLPVELSKDDLNRLRALRAGWPAWGTVQELDFGDIVLERADLNQLDSLLEYNRLNVAPTGTTNIDKESQAIALLLTIGPNAKKIAREIRVPRTTLLGWSQFRQRYDQVRAGAQVQKRRIPHGQKSKAGDIEAWDDEEDDD